MPKDQWNAVDSYLSSIVLAPDPVLDAALHASAAAGLPAINVSPNQGKFLQLLAKISGAKKILEIGTLGGYSSIWLARALPPGGKLITLEFEPKHAQVARENIDRAGFAGVVDVRVGAALETLPKLVTEGHDSFDFIFIDADKVNTAPYFTWALRLSHVGSIIIVDNVVRDGAIVQADSTDEGVQGVRKFNELLRAEKRVDATAIQTVGSKGYDGFAIALVMADTR
jgi:predicted O-methyltransferase YrrM